MLNQKRLTIASFCGLLFGFVCFGLASSSPGELPWPVAIQLIATRLLAGFAIGVSTMSLRHWSIHGLFMGAVFSVPLAFSGLMAPDSPEFSKTMMFVMTIVLGMIYGLLTEVITSVFFKARMNVPAHAPLLA